MNGHTESIHEYDNTRSILEAEDFIVQASSGKRFANYLIDVVGFYLVLLVVMILVMLANPAYRETIDQDTTGSAIGDRIFYLVLYGLYMFVIEALFKGKSFGKLITRTRAVNEDGSRLTIKNAFMRGIVRAVPFEAFSALGNPSYPWHDKWTKTYVIDEKQSQLEQ